MLAICLIELYLLPTTIALARGHRQTLAIGLLNVLIGWTVVAWVLSLGWAFTPTGR